MRFEICDMGWYPYYFRNELEGFEGKVYRLDDNGHVESVDPGMKQLLIEAARFWDGQIARLDHHDWRQKVDAANVPPASGAAAPPVAGGY